jgi:uncharacterized protein YukE
MDSQIRRLHSQIRRGNKQIDGMKDTWKKREGEHIESINKVKGRLQHVQEQINAIEQQKVTFSNESSIPV